VCQFKVIKRHFTALRLGRSATGVTITRLAPFRTNREHRQLFSEYFHAFGADPHVPVSKSKPMPAHLPASPDKPLYEFNLKGTETRSPTHKAHPDSCRGEFDQGQIIRIVLLVSSGDSAEVLEFVEEAFDQISAFVQESAEYRD